ncbi:sensor domain-containing diguanylate cyclase [Saccharospirillum salsuginis]|uniref:diguanylate cyclase n=1 Tax=Saccharospirillum salsuginis TaxID=418750 RepID=A0A918K3S6_9GAMM|nr:diguanylate cyclase [Saccharospirillum salsuginis]GGX44084.1 deoxynucleoside kinase [Saccharospirillum salsuginis]
MLPASIKPFITVGMALLLTCAVAFPVSADTAVWSGEQRLDVDGVIEGYYSFQTQSDPEADWQPLSDLDTDGYQPPGQVLHLRFNLLNTTTNTERLWLAIDASFLNHLWLSVGERSWLTGEDLPFDSRPIPHTGFVFPVTLEPGETVPVRAWIRSTLLHLPTTLWQPSAFMERALNISYRDMLYFGLMITLVVYCVLLFFATRVRAYLAFAVFAAVQAFFFMLIFGYGNRYGWPNHPEWNAPVSAITLYALVFTLGLMTLTMLGTDKRPPRLHALMKGMLAALVVIGAALAAFAERTTLMAFPVRWTLVLLVLIVAMLTLEIREGSRRAKWFALAWTPMLFGASALALSAFGWVPYGQPLISLLLTGMAVTSMLLSFIIALNIRDSVIRRQALEQETLQLKQEQANRLEQEVERRTAQLEESNRRLNQLALTDPLTGLPNRRQLDDFGDVHHRLMVEIGGDLFVAILDLDHFKSINDRFGHDAGDEVLTTMARTLAEFSVPPRATSNLLAGRLGGEEFALVGYELSEAEFARLLETIRDTIEDLRFAQLPSVQLTVSIGWSRAEPDQPLSSAFRQADQWLYQAKTGGRNRVCGEVVTA